VGSLETTGSGLIAKIGAGCGPDCMNRPLTRINVTAATAASPPRTSRRWRTRKRSRDAISASVPLKKGAIPPPNRLPVPPPILILDIMSCTFLYDRLEARRGGRCERRRVRIFGVLGRYELADRLRRALPFAVEREAHHHPRTLPDPAA